MADWKNRIVGQGEADPADIMPNPLNWRAHPQLQRSALMGVLAEVGWVQQVVVNKRTGNLIDGHLRVDLARSKGEKVPVMYVDLSEDEEKLILATLDPLAALANTDEDALKALLSQVSTDDEALAALLERLGGTPDLDPDALVEGEDYAGEAIGFGVEVIVTTPDDRDRASEALTSIGMTPKVRTIRNFDAT